MLVDVERRDFMRLITQTDVTIVRLSSGTEMTARLENLSASGCAFRSGVHFEAGEELEILVRGSSERIEPLRRSASVVRAIPGDAGYLVGVEFAH